ncbi:MAG TPA: CBS domain-containing protein [Blastocatellia bacterium]|nr:CBS domain-containing protein [Blastocatellia bacterium]
MLVSLWMSRDVVTITADTLITEAASLMMHRQIRRLPVVHQDAKGKHLIGIITNSDIYRAFPPEINPFSVIAQEISHSTITVGEVMKAHPLKTTPDTPIEEAARLMRDQKIAALPVVKDDELVGMITESDIFKAFLELLESQPGDVKITFDASKRHDLLEWVAERARKYDIHVESLISYQHDGRPLCLVRMTGKAVERFVDDLWRSGHPVLNVLRTN